MLRLLGIALIVLVIGIAVIFHGEIKHFSDTFVVNRQAQDYLKGGDNGSAVRLYEEKVKQNPENVDLAMSLANLYEQQGQSDKAIEVYRNLLSSFPGYTPAMVAYGRLQQEIPEKRNNVLSMYRKGLKQDPNNAALMSAIGNVYVKAATNDAETRGDVKNWLYDWAIYYYRNAIKRNPQLADARFNLGIAYQQTKRLEKAATSYCNALIISPNAFEARYNLGLTLVEMNALSEGYQQLDRAIKSLMEADRVSEAQALAERVQTIKNMVYNDNSNRGLDADLSKTALLQFLSPACLLENPTAEASNPEKSAE